MKRARLRFVALGLVFSAASALVGCGNKGPGAGNRWTSYPSLASSTTTYRWLVVKCQLADLPTIPSGLDNTIQQFFGISGTGYGNIVDYFHDVSYNHASVISDTFVGWNRAPFGTADLKGPNGRLSAPSTRRQRVLECLQAIPAPQLPDLAAFYGVVVVNNAVQDGGACYTGQGTMTINNKNYNLACVWFDPNSLITEFAAHEIGHGVGLDHSYDDSGRVCSLGAQPGEYCDPWDVMSAQQTYQFSDANWTVAGKPSGGGPGLNAPGLLRMGWLPTDNQRHFQYDNGEQTFNIRALSHPRRGDPMVVLIDVGSQTSFQGNYTVEYRQSDGWDQGFATNSNSPQSVHSSGGTVLVHLFRAAGAPASTLTNGAFAAALQPCNTLVLTGTGGTFHVTVVNFDTANGSALVSIGFGRTGPRDFTCLSDALRTTGPVFAHPHVPPGFRETGKNFSHRHAPPVPKGAVHKRQLAPRTPH